MLNIYDAAKVLGLTGNITPEITKKAYREACKKYHPDINPAGEEMMKVVNDAYDALKDHNGEIKQRKEQSDYGDLLNAALNVVLKHIDLKTEVCGAWIWVTGNTKEHKEELKAAGFRWAKKKKAWYFRPEGFKSRGRGKASLDEIRFKYGSVRPGFQSGKMLEGAA